MANIILIETSTMLCSTALARDGEIVSYRENSSLKAHASLTAPFIREMLGEAHLSLQDCQAVCVSMGPGSYTGLRVGVSTAKGLCFGAKVPMLAVGTLDTLVWQGLTDHAITGEEASNIQWKYIVPMVDARRMEVYTAVFTPDGKQITETEPHIVTEESFASQLAEGPVLFIGDGAGKCDKVINSPNAHFVNCCPKASAMLIPATAEYNMRNFRDVAYFEPFYLKEFVATVSKKKLF